MYMIHNNAALIAELRSSSAISQTDAEDLGADKGPNYRKNYHLISAILRRSDHSFECLYDALKTTRQSGAADYLKEGELKIFSFPQILSSTFRKKLNYHRNKRQAKK